MNAVLAPQRSDSAIAASKLAASFCADLVRSQFGATTEAQRQALRGLIYRAYLAGFHDRRSKT